MPRYTGELSAEEREQLFFVIDELNSRGIPVPKNYYRKIVKWSTDKRGYFPKADGRFFSPNDAQRDFLLSNARFVALISGRGGGKALAVDTPILTTSGWKVMGDISVGDKVFDENGNPSQVIFTSPVMFGHKCYDVVFSDDSVITADEEHLWLTWTHKARKEYARAKNPSHHPLVITTKDIKDTLIHWKKRGDINHSIPVCMPLQFPRSAELPIDPYVFGFWLGDGSSSSSRLTIGEKEIVPIIESKGIKLRKCVDKYSYQIIDVFIYRDEKTGRFVGNKTSFYGKLKSLNVLKNKHIPDIYLFSDLDSRLELLRGLMDSDGSVLNNGKMEIAFKNERLAKDVHYLLLSFGIKVTLNKQEAKLYGKPCGFRHRMSFRTSIRIFNLRRKFERIKETYRSEIYKRYIVDVIERESVPVKCITVASKSHLYLAGKTLIPTHNSAVGSQKSLQKIKEGQNGAVLNPDFENFRIATWPEFVEWIPWDMVVPAHRYRRDPSYSPNQPFTMAFMNGVKVICKGLKDPDSARGPNINWLWYDEAGRDRDGLAWQTAVASVRVGKDPQAWITTTPKGRNHWIYKFFIKQDIPQEAFDLFKAEGGDRELIEVFNTTIRDNINNLDPGFVAAMLAAYPVGWLRDQEIDGKFVDETGSLGDRNWFNGKILPEVPESVMKRVVYWDLAGSEKKSAGKKASDPDEFVRTKLSMNQKMEGDKLIPVFTIEHQYATKRPEWADFKRIFAEWAEKDGATVPIFVEEEPGSGGINQVEELKLYIKETLGSAYHVEGHNPKKYGDKVMRANPWFAEASNGQFFLVQGNWNEGFLEQLAGFPDNVDHDDRVDSVSGARLIIAPFRTWKNIGFLKV